MELINKNHQILVCCIEYISLLSKIIGFDQNPPNFSLLSRIFYFVVYNNQDSGRN